MNKITRALLAAGVVAALLGGGEAAARYGGHNEAVAINTKDGSSIFRLAFHVRRTMDRVIDHSNVALAYASCESCQTVAVAIQLVLVMSDPDVVTPTNLAVAINERCTSCETLASAYQYVVSTDGPVHFDAQGTRELAAVRKAFRDLAKRSPDMAIADIQTEVGALVERLYAAVDGHLVPVGGRRQDDDDTHEAEGEEEETPVPEESQPAEATEPAPEPTSEAEATPSPDSSPEESSTPTPQPTETS